MYPYYSNTISFISKTNKNRGLRGKKGMIDSKLFKEKFVFTLTPTTPTGVLIGLKKDHIHDTVANPIAILLMKVVLDNSLQS